MFKTTDDNFDLEVESDIFRERLFSQEMVFVANTELKNQWMLQEGKFPMSLKQEPSLLFAEVYPQLKRGLFFRGGDEWFHLRKLSHCIVNKNASDFELEGLFDNCEEFLHDYMSNLRQTICGGGDTGEMIDLEDRAYEIAIGTTIRIVYGQYTDTFKKYTGTDLSTLSRNAKEINVCCQKLLEMPIRLAKWFGSSTWAEYSAKLHHNISACIKYGDRRREEILRYPDAASMRTHGLLYKTVQLNAPLQDINDLLSDFAADTKDPLAGTIMFATQVLAAHPDIQEKILDEINQVFPLNERITYGKSKYLEYTKAFLKEALRLYPVAPLTARVTSEDTVIGGYLIPPGAMIMYSTYVAQRDPRYFSDPLKVIPERWLGDSKSSNNEPNGKNSFGHRCDSDAFASFGLNKRLCVGQNISISIFVMYIGNLVKFYKLRTDEMPEVEMRTILYPAHPEKPIYFEVRQ